MDDIGFARQRSESFSPRNLGSLDRARSAIDHREGALEIVSAGDAVPDTEKAVWLTVGELTGHCYAARTGIGVSCQHPPEIPLETLHRAGPASRRAPARRVRTAAPEDP